MEAPMNPQMPRQGTGTGFLIATILLIAVIVIGALYFWRARGTEADKTLQTVETQSTSDDAAAIESDLNATDINGADYDLNESNFTSS